MKILIDADYIVYKSCAAAESEVDFGNDVILVTSNFTDAYNAAKREITRIEQKLGNFSTTILFFSDSVNFRKNILPSYKGHRNRKKPLLEGDDALGIYATKFPGNIIVSPDKDMKQIPGQLYNFDDVFTITAEEGAKWHLLQTMAGDNTDGYAGVPTIGIKRAEKIFEEKGYTWKAVVETFEEKGMTEEDALTNARLAKILTADDYDFQRKEPKLWSPSSDYKVDDGAGSKDEANSRQTKTKACK